MATRNIMLIAGEASGDRIAARAVRAVNQLASAQIAGVTQVFLAPVVDNRQVQSLVRVANDTPFIIGGLIATQTNQSKTGVPGFQDLPFIGEYAQHAALLSPVSPGNHLHRIVALDINSRVHLTNPLHYLTALRARAR